MNHSYSASIITGESPAWQRARTLSLILTLPFFLLFLFLLEERFSRQAVEEHLSSFLAKLKTEKKDPHRSYQFILVDPPEEPLEEEVTEARLIAALQQQARDRLEEERRDKTAPHNEGKSPVPVVKTGIPLPPQPEGEKAQATPPPRPKEEASPEVPADENPRKPQPREEIPAVLPTISQVVQKDNEKALMSSPSVTETAVPMAPKDPSPVRPEESPPVADANNKTPARPKSPTPPSPSTPPLTFLPIGARASTEGETKSKSSDSSSSLTGDKAYQTLLARYPKYMAEVLQRVGRQFYVLCNTKPRSYHTGELIFQLGISADGSLSSLKMISAPESMLSEITISRSAIELGAPFPPLTEEMQKDPLFTCFGFRFIFW